MRSRSLLFLAACLPLAGATAFADDSPLKVTELAVCREVVDRGCESEGLSFGPDVESVAFLTKVEGATGEAYIEHRWLFESKEVRRVQLPIRAARYRTWSAKRVRGLPGRWRVEALDPVGRSLGAVDFTVRPPALTP